MTNRESSRRPTPRKPAPLRLAGDGPHMLHIVWLEAAARRSDRITISAAFARELAAVLRQRLRVRAA